MVSENKSVKRFVIIFLAILGFIVFLKYLPYAVILLLFVGICYRVFLYFKGGI